ncbi:hypothetical protein C0989_002137 [Termitomyces sp. Mn162]|nr:hypothetical protein C0989_002137 [Termitomyces sp. Mn162]
MHRIHLYYQGPRMENHVRAHTGGIQGLDTTGNFAFTIGLGERQSRPFPDPLVKIYDLRTMRSLPPIAFSSGPAFIHVLPKRASTIVIVSNQGLVNIVDVVNPAASEFYQLDLASYVTSCSVSATAAYVAFGDADGAIHLLSQAEDTVGVPFNGFDGKPVDWADTPAELAEIDWMDSTPLNTIGLPHYDTQLLSAWTPLMKPSIVVYPPPSKIPAQLLNTMKMKDNVAYAALPRELKGRRNVVGVESQRRHNGRFRSGKATKIESSAPVYEYVDEEVPQMYRQVEIEYSKFGVEDFDFGHALLSPYSNFGKITYHYQLPEGALLALRVRLRTSNSIELVDYGRDGIEVDYAHRIQIFHRFLIELLSSEGNSFPNNPSLLKTPSSLSSSHPLSAAPITQLLSIDSKNTTTCTSCGAVREKDNMSHLVDLIYPRKGPSNEPHPVLDFCSSPTFFISRRSIPSQDLPPILAINACIHNEENLNLWLDVRGQTFLQTRLQLHGQVGGVDDPVGVEYTIRSFVVQILTKNKQSHLVAIVRVPEAEKRTDLISPWFIFNDFVVRNIPEEEALSFPDKWKVPAIVYYERSDLVEVLDYSRLPNSIDETILCHDTSISLNRDPHLIKHEALLANELPRPGTFVAIDAEFVSMQQVRRIFESAD